MSSNVLTASDIPASVFAESTANGVAVSVRGLSKAYRIARASAKHTTIGEALMHRLKNPLEKVERDEFWALRDVSFEIQKGDVVGIIGRNGAGKSTLLKVLSRITEPTAGVIDLYGRVGSLLEVGTGFHPELTGRENVFLNGAILGMKKSEITRQFDAIVDFSGTEKFLDTPVKRYSSGMYVRLAFAVAAHLNPEILIVDEVLAVGDADFQKKCLGKMQDAASQGNTVLFVSHNIPTVLSLCTRAIYMKNGQQVGDGSPEDIIAEYSATGLNSSGELDLTRHEGRVSKSKPIMKAIRIKGKLGETTSLLRMDEPFTLEIDYAADMPISNPRCGVGIYNSQSIRVVSFATFFDKGYRAPSWSSRGTLRCQVENAGLMPGHYSLVVTLGDATTDLDRIEQGITFEVAPWDVFGTGIIPSSSQGMVWTNGQSWEHLDSANSCY